MRLPLKTLWVLFLLLPALGCKDEESLGIKLLLRSTEKCQSKEGGNELTRANHKVRLSFLRRTNVVGPLSQRRFELICYRVIPSNADPQDFIVDTDGSGSVSVLAEAFDSTKQILAHSGLTSPGKLGGALSVGLIPTAGSTCDSNPQLKKRAFHSATLLPNGQVLFLGGIHDGLTSAGAAGTDVPQIYDPAKLKTVNLTAATGFRRAFHKALLLPSKPEGPYRILLIGGITVASNAAQLVKFDTAPLLVLPGENATAGETALVTFTPGDSGGVGTIEYKALPDLNIHPGFFPRLAMVNDRQAFLVPGAGAFDGTAFSAPQNRAYWLTLGDSAEALPTVSSVDISQLGTRVGQAVGLSAQGPVISGGLLDGDLTTGAVLVSPSEGSPFQAKTTPTNYHPGAFGTLTPLGLTDPSLANGDTALTLLRAIGLPGREATGAHDYAPEANCNCQGAFQLCPGSCGDYPPQQIDLPTSSPSVQVLASAPPALHPPGGYGTATRLHDGRVLLAGGNLSACPGETDVLDSIYCAANNMAIATAAPQLSLETAGTMRQARYGHTATRLLDNSVLIAGGLQVTPDSNLALHHELEVYNLNQSRTLTDAPLWLVDKDGNVVGKNQMTEGPSPLRCPLRSGEESSTAKLKAASRVVISPGK